MQITTVEAAEQNLVTKVYPVGDLVVPIMQLGGMGGGMGGAMGAPLTPLTSLRASLTGGQPAQYAQNVRCAQPYQHQQPTAMAYHATVQPPSTAGQFSRRTGASWQGVAGARLST